MKKKLMQFFQLHRLRIYGGAFLLTLLLTIWSAWPKGEETILAHESNLLYQPDIKIKTTKGTLAWPKNTVLPEGQAGYFYAAEPQVTFLPKMELTDASGEQLTGELTVSIILKTTENGNRTFWETPLVETVTYPIKFSENEEGIWGFVAPSEKVQINEVEEMIQAVNEELNFSGGEYTLLHTAEITVNGTLKGKEIERTQRFEAPLVLTSSYFTAPMASETTNHLNLLTTTTQETKESTVWLWIGNHWLMIGATVVFLILFLKEWTSQKQPVEESDKEYKRFKEWITEGKVSLGNRTLIKVYSLEGLVDLAIDLEKRVLHDPQKNEYTVLEDSFAYMYAPRMQSQTLKTNLTSLRDLLLRMKLIDKEELELGLNYRRMHGGRLGETLVSLGFLNETSLYSALAKQAGMNFFTIDPAAIPVQLEWLGDMDIKSCIQHEVIPIGKKGDTTVVAYGSAETDVIKEKLEKKFKSDLEFVMAEPARIRQVIDRYDAVLIQQSKLSKWSSQSMDSTTREEQVRHFVQLYELKEFDLLEFIRLSEIVPTYELLIIPENRSIVRWLVRRNLLSSEEGHLLNALETAIEELTKIEAHARHVPDFLEILRKGGFITKDDVIVLVDAYGENLARQKQFMIDHFIVSEKTIQMLEDYLSKLLRLFQEAKTYELNT